MDESDRNRSRDETSVVTDLRQLRHLEDERVRDERAAARRAEEAKAEAARQRAEEDAARIRAAEEAARQRHEAAARATGAAERRVREAEAQAREWAAVEIERLRIAAEAELRRQEVARRRPAWLLAATGALLATATALVWMYTDRRDEAAIAARRRTDAVVQSAALEEQLRVAEHRREQLGRQLADALARLSPPRRTRSGDPCPDRSQREAPRPKPPRPPPPPVIRPAVIDVGDCALTPLGCAQK